MHSIVGAVVGGAGALAADFDPTVQPAPGSFFVFVFLLVSVILLILSFLRHLRRAQANLGSSRQYEEAAAASVAGPEAYPGAPVEPVEDDAR